MRCGRERTLAEGGRKNRAGGRVGRVCRGKKRNVTQ